VENLYTVGQVFADRVFCVPDYQRGYAWEQQQCQDFIEDLELLGPDKEHFLGLLILHPHSDAKSRVVDQGGRAYDVYDVIDGQQRLTTIVLFLNALRREMECIENLRALAAGLCDIYIVMRDLNGQPRPKLTLNRDTHAFFYDAVLEQSETIQGPTIRSHQLLAEAKGCFTAYLDRKRQSLKDGYPEWLKNEYLKIAQKLTLVVYTARSEADAGVVFETMNNRGKELAELEKVKNYLLYTASKLELPAEHDLADEVNSTWTHIFESLMGAGLSSADNEEQLLRAHWLMAYDYDPKKWNGSRSVKARFDLRKYQDRHQVLLEDLTAYLSSLRNATTAYCDIYNPTRPNAFGNFQADQTLRASIVATAGKLARLDVPATFLPLLMAARLRYPQDGNAYLEVLEMSEKFVFRVYRWLERPAYTARTWIFRLGHDLYHEGDISGILNELRVAVLRYCPDTQFEGRFQQAGVNWFQWPGLTYFLYEYEYHLAERAGQPVRMPWETATRKKDTIEHVLPQTLDEGGYWAERFTPEMHRQYVHDIGNLTLTYDNSALGNKSFPEKKGSVNRPSCYASSKLYIEQQLAGYDEWTEVEIIARRQELANWAMGRWHVEPVDLAQPSPETEAIAGQIRLIVARGFIPRGQLVLFKVLYEAGEQGVSLSKLPEKMRVDPEQIRGILGALGRRVNYTKGLRTQKPGIGMLLEWRRSAVDWYYYMRPELKAAIEALPRLHEAITGCSVAEIDKKYKEVWDSDPTAQRNDLDLPARS
jgi:hypothetical protein